MRYEVRSDSSMSMISIRGAVASGVFRCLVVAVSMVGACNSAEAMDRVAVARATKATVLIEVGRVYQGFDFSNVGSGFFVGPDGSILTNWHVVGDQITTEFRGVERELSLTVIHINVVVNPGTPEEKKMPAKVVAMDRKRDLALLSVGYRSPHWITPAKGAVVDILDEVCVIGFPFGDLLTFNENGGILVTGHPQPSVNLGRVTALRSDQKGRPVAIQTDAGVNPGNSGGPMLNARGQLVGVIYAKVDLADQIGFAISPQRVWQFYSRRLVKVSFMPPYVPRPRSTITLTVEPGILSLDAVRGTATVSGAGIKPFSVDLVRVSGRWEGLIDVPEIFDGQTSEASFLASLRFVDDRGREVFKKVYRLKEVESSEVGLGSRRDPVAMMRDRTLANKMSIHDYASKKSSERAAEAPVESPSKQAPAARQPPESRPAPAEVRPSNPEPEETDPLSRGKVLYREGRYEEAAAAFREALESDPDNAVAGDYLDLATERLALAGPAEETAGAGSVDAVKSAAVVPPTLKILFDSPLKEGVIKLWIDNELLTPVTFKFKKKGGRIDENRELPLGRHRISVLLEDDDGRSLTLSNFEEVFAGGSSWTLRITMNTPEARPGVYLIKAR